MDTRDEPDAWGVVTTVFDVGAISTLKGRRSRERPGTPLPLDTLPADWRDLLTRWVRQGNRCKWDSLLKKSGARQVETAVNLLDWLLHHGWVRLEEQRQSSAWRARWVQFREIAELRRALGLKDADDDAMRWADLRAQLASGLDPGLDPVLAPLLAALDALPVARALARIDLVSALVRWQAEARCGTQRDFALFARGSTKSLTDADWNWLDLNIDLVACRIERHTPLLLLAAPCTLQVATGALNLAASADFAALTPASVAAATSADGAPALWQLVENRTSFERVARRRAPDTGVIWLPGYPPHWWHEAVAQLLKLAPAPALIACDPDPAGVAIALQAGQVWQAAGLAWQPWHMDISSLQGLPHRSALNAWDDARIVQLLQSPDLPQALRTLLEYMQQHNIKGEQEGIAGL
jgi:hypothetical protein